MLEVLNCVTPSPEQWDAVIKGMRLPMKSTNKNDSIICDNFEVEKESCYEDCPHVDNWEGEEPYMTPICRCSPDQPPVFVLGKEDKKLAMRLAKISTSERKYLRQLPLILEVKAPLYWWKQADQYKIGTTTSSESTMHTLTKKPFKLEDFSVRNYRGIFGSETEEQLSAFEDLIVSDLNDLRDRYLETNDMEFWRAINETLPQSYLQTRTWSMNYETALNIIEQRRGHKNKEWDVLIDYMLGNIPYLNELYKASQYKKERMKELEERVKELETEVHELKQMLGTRIG